MIERRKKRKDIDFIEFARQHIQMTPNETRTVKTTGINALCHFLKYKNGNDKLLIKDLTSKLLREYEMVTKRKINHCQTKQNSKTRV